MENTSSVLLENGNSTEMLLLFMKKPWWNYSEHVNWQDGILYVLFNIASKSDFFCQWK